MTTSFAPSVNQGLASPASEQVSLPAAEPERPQPQLLTEINNPSSGVVQLAQASTEIPNILRPGEQPSVVPNQTQPESRTNIPDIPRPNTPPSTSNPTAATPQQFQFTLQQIQTLDRVRTMLGNGNYGQPLDSVRLQMVTRTNYTQAEINGLGNSLHAMVSGMLIAADQQAQRIDEYTPAGGARFTVDQLHAGGIGVVRQALRNAGIPTEPMYVGIRREQDIAAASSSTAAPVSATVNPNATSTTPVVADPNSVPPVVTTPALTATPANERSQATPALQVVPSNIGTTEEENVTKDTIEAQPMAPAIPRPDAVFAEYRRRQRLEGEVA